MHTCTTALLAVVWVDRPAWAQVAVRFEPPTQTVNLGEQFTVDIVGDITEPVVGWGLDLTISDEAIVSLVGSPVIGPAWVPAFTPDADDLAGIAFPDSVSGTGVLLATLTLSADAVGQVELTLSTTPGDLTEGFPLEAPTQFAAVTFESGSATIRCLYDLDEADCPALGCDSGVPCTDPGDFAFFVPCWLMCAGEPGWVENNCNAADFDCTGCVDPGDFAFFVTAWLKCCDDAAIVLPACRSRSGQELPPASREVVEWFGLPYPDGSDRRFRVRREGDNNRLRASPKGSSGERRERTPD
jgi:hypothetical protein